MVEIEITRVKQATPIMARSQGKTKSGVSYQSWLANFPRSYTPRSRLRIFDKSGIALTYKPRQTIQQCKRCLGFHPTRGCSRAPVCANCASTMHLTTDYKPPATCHNCVGPHKSESLISGMNFHFYNSRYSRKLRCRSTYLNNSTNEITRPVRLYPWVDKIIPFQ